MYVILIRVNNIWKELQLSGKPITVLAPMEEVTDTVFRQIIRSVGSPDIFFTEFTSVEGIASVGQASVLQRLQYSPSEQPLIAQLWGTTPEHYYTAAKLAQEMGFVGLDINMGCPVPKVIKRGACSALINNHSLAKEIVAACREGLQGEIPLSIKTRLGFGSIQVEEWIGYVLQDLRPDALTIHLRTVKELSEPEPHWETLPNIMELKNKYHPECVLIANGNIKTINQVNQLCSEYGIDGGMIGRGVFDNPWVFAGRDVEDIQASEKLDLLLRHTELFVKTWGITKNFAALKRFFKIYVHGFDGAKELRMQLMECGNNEEVQKYIQQCSL